MVMAINNHYKHHPTIIIIIIIIIIDFYATIYTHILLLCLSYCYYKSTIGPLNLPGYHLLQLMSSWARCMTAIINFIMLSIV